MASSQSATALQILATISSVVEHFRLPTKPCETRTVVFAQLTTPVPVCHPSPTSLTARPSTKSISSPNPAVPASPVDLTHPNSNTQPASYGSSTGGNKWLSLDFPIILILAVFITGWLPYRFARSKQYDTLYPNRVKSIWWNPPVRERERVVFVGVEEECRVRGRRCIREMREDRKRELRLRGHLRRIGRLGGQCRMKGSVWRSRRG